MPVPERLKDEERHAPSTGKKSSIHRGSEPIGRESTYQKLSMRQTPKLLRAMVAGRGPRANTLPLQIAGYHPTSNPKGARVRGPEAADGKNRTAEGRKVVDEYDPGGNKKCRTGTGPAWQGISTLGILGKGHVRNFVNFRKTSEGYLLVCRAICWGNVSRRRFDTA